MKLGSSIVLRNIESLEKSSKPRYSSILMFDHHMSMIIVDKFMNILSNSTNKAINFNIIVIKKDYSLDLIWSILRQMIALNFKITYLNCKSLNFDRTFGGMKDSYGLMKSLLTDTFRFMTYWRSLSRLLLMTRYYLVRKVLLMKGLHNLMLTVCMTQQWQQYRFERANWSV
jgi:hypothetical protein